MSSALLQLKALVAGFDPHFRLPPVSFEADAGVVFVSGINGSGKTTLLRTLCGELPALEGQVEIDGKDVHEDHKVRGKIGFVPSNPELPEFLTVTQVFQFVASLRGQPQWDGTPFCEALSLPPDLLLAHASAGQKSKAELICGLAADPQILLLDESFAHLDSASIDTLKDWIAQWRTSRLILITHHGKLPLEANQVLDLSQ